MTYIYESPDSGQTVYRRQAGQHERELVHVSEKKKHQEQIAKEWAFWVEILTTAQHTPALQDALDRVKIIYALHCHD